MASFDGMDRGISKSGAEAVYKKIKTEYIDKAIEDLENYKTFENALKEAWSGGDREVFMQNFIKLKDEIKEKLQIYRDNIKKEFDRINTDWEDFQKSNVVAK